MVVICEDLRLEMTNLLLAFFRYTNFDSYVAIECKQRTLNPNLRRKLPGSRGKSEGAGTDPWELVLHSGDLV